MTETASTDPVVFDLRNESRDSSTQVKSVRVMYAFLSVLFIGVVALFASAAATYGIGGFLWIAFPVVFLCLSILLGQFLLLLWKTQPGAVSVGIGEQGIEFGWASGRADFLSWSMVSRDLVLGDHSADGTILSGYYWFARRWNRPTTRLSKVAVDAVIRASVEKGLGLREQYHRPTPFNWGTYRIVRFAEPDTPGGADSPNHHSQVSTPPSRTKTSHRRKRIFIIVAVVAVLAFAVTSPYTLLVNTWGLVGPITETGPATTLFIGCGNEQTIQTARCASGTLIGTDVNLQLALAAVTNSTCELTSLIVYSPYRLVSVSPPLPQPFGVENATGVIVEHLIHVTVQVPWIAGTYNVSSSLDVACS
jgi:hypothetical protein